MPQMNPLTSFVDTNRLTSSDKKWKGCIHYQPQFNCSEKGGQSTMLLNKSVVLVETLSTLITTPRLARNLLVIMQTGDRRKFSFPKAKEGVSQQL